MKTTFAIILLLLFSASFFLFWKTPPDTPLEGPSLIQTPTSPREGKSLRADGKHTETPGSRKTLSGKKGGDVQGDPEYQAALIGLRGRVLWKSSRKPVAGIKIKVYEFRSSFSIQDWNGNYPDLLESFEPKQIATTDRKGRFVLNGLERSEVFILLIGPGTDKRAFRIVNASPDPGKASDLGDILLQDRGALEGSVLGPNQRPVSGAMVYALDIPRIAFDFGLAGYEPEGLLVNQNPSGGFAIKLPAFTKKLVKELSFGIARTGDDGKFQIKGLPKGLTPILFIAKDLVRTVKTTRIRPGETRDLGTITLKKGHRFSGKVLDSKGEPLPGILVSISPKTPMMFRLGLGREPKATDANGSFEFNGLGRGQHYILTKRREDLPWKLHGPYRQGDKVEIRVERTFTRKIFVKTPGGKPVTQAAFRLFLDLNEDLLQSLFDGELNIQKHLQKGGEPGTWLLHDLPKRDYSLHVSAKGFAPSKVRIPMGKEWTSKPVLCRLSPGASVSVRVRSKAGKPISSARVFFRRGEGNRVILLGRTGRNGVLKTPTIPMIKGALIGEHPRFALGRTPIPAPAPGANYIIVLPNPGKLVGRIFDSTSPEKKIYTLFLEPTLDTWRLFGGLLPTGPTISKIDGTFSLGGLQPGTYRIRPSYKPGTIETFSQAAHFDRADLLSSFQPIKVLVPEGGVAQVFLDLAQNNGKKKQTAGIFGFVRVNGKSRSGMEVALWGRSTQDRKEVALWGKSTQQTVTKTDGSFRFSRLPKDHYEVLLIDKTDGITDKILGTKFITLKEGEEKELNFDIYLGLLEVQILDPKGHPIDGAQITLEPMGKRSSTITVHTDDQGRIHEKVPFGKWRIQLDRKEREQGGFSLAEKVIEVGSPRPVRFTIRAIPDLVIQGTIRLDYSKVHPDWIEQVQKDFPNKAWFEIGDRWWQVPLKPGGAPSPLDGKKHPTGDYSVTAYGYRTSWSAKVKITPENHLSLDIVLTPSKKFTLPKKPQGKETSSEKKAGKRE
ncbi:MAG TPA: hypothetical protein ENK02_13425 [Planctomycetes bacterium]|nr:hypothetical protein [Planctomycetota bacterium]